MPPFKGKDVKPSLVETFHQQSLKSKNKKFKKYEGQEDNVKPEKGSKGDAKGVKGCTWASLMIGRDITYVRICRMVSV